MRRLLIIISLLLFGLLALQCAREVIIELPEEPSKIVVVGKFTTNDTFRVRVTLTQPVYQPGELEAPASAVVTVAKEGELYAKLSRKVTSAGVFWQSRKLVEPNVAYTINVQLGGYPLTSATSAVPKHVDIEPVNVDSDNITTENLADGRRQLRVPIVLQLAGPLPADPYFAFNLTSNIDVGNQDPPDFQIEDRQGYFAVAGSTLSLLHNITENVVLINEKYWSDDRRTLHLDALIPFDPALEEHPVSLNVEWRTLSPEFYRYHLSVARQGSNLPLSEPDAVFNNVQNGYGNFSGYSATRQVIELPR